MFPRPVSSLVLLAALVVPAIALAGDTQIHKINTPFEVSFVGNPGAGFVWRLDAEASTNADLVVVADTGYAPPPADQTRVGADAAYGFTIAPLAAGQVELVFVYQRPWESEPLRTERLSFEITE